MRIEQILVCFALKEEAAPFRTGLRRGHHVSILLTGIGRQNAEKSLREFLVGGASVPPNLVLTCGFAGGLNPDLKPGDVIFETSDETLRTKLLGAGAKQLKIFCADRIATTVAEKKKLRDETGTDAVEMESAAIHAVCRERGIPCATVRVISDTANEDLPLDFNALSKPDKNLDFGKLFLAIARSPGKIPALMQLQKKTKFAAEQLAAVLAKIIFP
jgi:adenosylhomocysteine nucleosidase